MDEVPYHEELSDDELFQSFVATPEASGEELFAEEVNWTEALFPSLPLVTSLENDLDVSLTADQSDGYSSAQDCSVDSVVSSKMEELLKEVEKIVSPFCLKKDVRVEVVREEGVDGNGKSKSQRSSLIISNQGKDSVLTHPGSLCSESSNDLEYVTKKVKSTGLQEDDGRWSASARAEQECRTVMDELLIKVERIARESTELTRLGEMNKGPEQVIGKNDDLDPCNSGFGFPACITSSANLATRSAEDCVRRLNTNRAATATETHINGLNADISEPLNDSIMTESSDLPHSTKNRLRVELEQGVRDRSHDGGIIDNAELVRNPLDYVRQACIKLQHGEEHLKRLVFVCLSQTIGDDGNSMHYVGYVFAIKKSCYLYRMSHTANATCVTFCVENTCLSVPLAFPCQQDALKCRKLECQKLRAFDTETDDISDGDDYDDGDIVKGKQERLFCLSSLLASSGTSGSTVSRHSAFICTDVAAVGDHLTYTGYVVSQTPKNSIFKQASDPKCKTVKVTDNLTSEYLPLLYPRACDVVNLKSISAKRWIAEEVGRFSKGFIQGSILVNDAVELPEDDLENIPRKLIFLASSVSPIDDLASPISGHIVLSDEGTSLFEMTCKPDPNWAMVSIEGSCLVLPIVSSTLEYMEKLKVERSYAATLCKGFKIPWLIPISKAHLFNFEPLKNATDQTSHQQCDPVLSKQVSLKSREEVRKGSLSARRLVTEASIKPSKQSNLSKITLLDEVAVDKNLLKDVPSESVQTLSISPEDYQLSSLAVPRPSRSYQHDQLRDKLPVNHISGIIVDVLPNSVKSQLTKNNSLRNNKDINSNNSKTLPETEQTKNHSLLSSSSADIFNSKHRINARETLGGVKEWQVSFLQSYGQVKGVIVGPGEVPSSNGIINTPVSCYRLHNNRDHLFPHPNIGIKKIPKQTSQSNIFNHQIVSRQSTEAATSNARDHNLQASGAKSQQSIFQSKANPKPFLVSLLNPQTPAVKSGTSFNYSDAASCNTLQNPLSTMDPQNAVHGETPSLANTDLLPKISNPQISAVNYRTTSNHFKTATWNTFHNLPFLTVDPRNTVQKEKTSEAKTSMPRKISNSQSSTLNYSKTFNNIETAFSNTLQNPSPSTVDPQNGVYRKTPPVANIDFPPYVSPVHSLETVNKTQEIEPRAVIKEYPIDSQDMGTKPRLLANWSSTGQSSMLAKSRARQKSCQSCANCKRADCRRCVYCLDMKKYGGNGLLKQRCIERRCAQPVANFISITAKSNGMDKKELENRRNKVMGNCWNCPLQDCQKCTFCKDETSRHGTSKCRKRCPFKICTIHRHREVVHYDYINKIIDFSRLCVSPSLEEELDVMTLRDREQEEVDLWELVGDTLVGPDKPLDAIHDVEKDSCIVNKFPTEAVEELFISHLQPDSKRYENTESNSRCNSPEEEIDVVTLDEPADMSEAVTINAPGSLASHSTQPYPDMSVTSRPASSGLNSDDKVDSLAVPSLPAVRGSGTGEDKKSFSANDSTDALKNRKRPSLPPRPLISPKYKKLVATPSTASTSQGALPVQSSPSSSVDNVSHSTSDSRTPMIVSPSLYRTKAQVKQSASLVTRTLTSSQPTMAGKKVHKSAVNLSSGSEPVKSQEPPGDMEKDSTFVTVSTLPSTPLTVTRHSTYTDTREDNSTLSVNLVDKNSADLNDGKIPFIDLDIPMDLPLRLNLASNRGFSDKCFMTFLGHSSFPLMVQYLDLSGTLIGDDTIHLIAVSMTDLISLNTTYCSMVTDTGVQSLAEHGAGTLRYLYLRQCDLTSDVLSYLNMPGFSRLEWVDLNSCKKIQGTAISGFTSAHKEWSSFPSTTQTKYLVRKSPHANLMECSGEG